MNKWAYYNDSDPAICAWVSELIKAGLVAPGEVDCRSITEVQPHEVQEFCQRHWFCGVATWSYSLRRAGWPDDRPVNTLSLPCQPFSAAGKRDGFTDDRHLWPVMYALLAELMPPVLFGEQVSSKDALDWFDVVKPDLNTLGYAVMAADIPASAFGAPHIRQRLYFVAERKVDRL